MRKLLLLAVAAAAPLGAQAQTIRLIAAPDARTKPVFGTVTSVRQLPGGQVLVNDGLRRQLSLLDQSFGAPAIVADSGAGAANSYGIRAGGLVPYLADSTLFIDPAGLSMFVLDPAGKIARVASVPRSQDASFMTAANVGLDSKGRIVYRGGLLLIRNPTAPAPGAGGAGFVMPEPPDSTSLLRVDLASRKVDTAGWFKIPKTKMNMTQNERGGFSATSEINPMPLVDDWAVLANGSIALVRGQDYHVDFVDADGKVTNGAKIPFDWQRLTDDDKVAVIDSSKKAMDAARAAAASAAAGSNPNLVAIGAEVGAVTRTSINFSTADGGGGGGMGQRMMAPGGMSIGGAGSVAFVQPSDLPDYRPAFSTNAARADADGNLWVRTSAVRQGTAGFVYDVINGQGQLVDRLQIPAGRTIAGFGKGGVVYMVARDASGAWLERTHR